MKSTIYFWRVFDIANDISLAFRASQSSWWMNGKTFTILNPFVGIFSDYGR